MPDGMANGSDDPWLNDKSINWRITMNKKLRQLLAKKNTLHEECTALNDASEDGVLTEENQKSFDAKMSEIESLDTQIERERALALNAASLSGDDVLKAVAGDGDESIISVKDAKIDPMGGFSHLGDFASAVMGTKLGAGIDERLLVGAAAPSTISREAIGNEGGFLVPQQMSQEIFALMLGEESFIPLTDNTPTEGNSMTYRNSGEVTPWGSSGVQAYWTQEGAAITPSQISPKSDEIKLHKLAALVPVTNEMMADVSALTAYLTNEGSQSMMWKANNAIISGDGVGKPKGITASDALVEQAKEDSQTAATINATNAAKMYGRWHKRTAGQRVLVNPGAINQLMLMTLGDQPIWTPPLSGFTEAPDGFLFGRPVTITDQLQALGTKNDFMFVDFGFYRTLTKVGGGIRTDVSLHLYFDSDNACFRFIFRLGGQSKMAAAIQPPNSGETRSPFVTLATRS